MNPEATLGETSENKVVFNPFPGLRSFNVEESYLFFGREGQSDEVLSKLAGNRFVAILGTSGSGKSSLMYCGLIPTLYGGFMTAAGSKWRVILSRPGSSPIKNLAEALIDSDTQQPCKDEREKQIRLLVLASVLKSTSLGLIETIAQMREDEEENYFILLDQFEELFRFRQNDEDGDAIEETVAFINLLLESIHQFEVPIYVAITMRSDFIGDCAAYPEFTQLINDSHYLIPQMTRQQKRLAIEGPVAVGSGEISERFVQQLLNDVGDNPDQLPVLQHALMRTWQYWLQNRSEGEPMDLRHYAAIGTLKGALSQHANEAFDSLTRKEQRICEIMFKAITEKGTENQGVRRPTPIRVISSLAKVESREVIQVVNKFRQPGRSLLMPPYEVPLDEDSVIDVSHESLMRLWIRLKTWLEEETRSAEMYLKLSEAAERYQMGQAGLWKMPDLQLAINWREENQPTVEWAERYDPAFERTMVFLETSKRAYETDQRNKEVLQKRALRNSRLAAVFLGGAAVISLIFVILAQIQKNRANDQEILAKEQAIRAEQQAERANLNAERAQRERLRADSARRISQENAALAKRNERRALAASRILEAQKDTITQQRDIALAAKYRADESTRYAKEQERVAKVAKTEAEEAKDDEEKLRYQAIARSLALKSTQIRNKQLKGLVARQAYVFDAEYGDREFNADVYYGIYFALKALEGERMNKFIGHPDGVRSVICDPASNMVYTAGGAGQIYQWDLTDPERNYTPIYSSGEVSRAMDLSSDGQVLAVGTQDHNVELIYLDDLSREPDIVSTHNGTVWDIAFIPKTHDFVSSGNDGTVKLYAGGDTKILRSVGSMVKSLSINKNGTKLALGDEQGIIRVVDLRSLETKDLFVNPENSPVRSIAFNPFDRLMAIGFENGDIFIWDLLLNEEVIELQGHRSRVTDLEFSPDNKLLASSSFDGSAKLWKVDNLTELPIILDDHIDFVWSLSFRPNGNYLVTGSGDKYLRLWPVKPDQMANKICEYLSRNMTEREWFQYVGGAVDYMKTCSDVPISAEIN